jgi:hypothetical protein
MNHHASYVLPPPRPVFDGDGADESFKFRIMPSRLSPRKNSPLVPRTDSGFIVPPHATLDDDLVVLPEATAQPGERLERMPTRYALGGVDDDDGSNAGVREGP